jgi:parallel beta-helix repeat protein
MQVSSVRLKKLAAVVCAVFSCGPALATTRYVNNCLDDFSEGSLRGQLQLSAANDTIDLASQLPLTCSTITLVYGEVFGPNGISLIGPTDRRLTIETSTQNRVLIGHALNVSYLNFRGGAGHHIESPYQTFLNPYRGGCIDSDRDVQLDHVTVSDCTGLDSYSFNNEVYGVGVYAAGKLGLVNSVVTNNNVSSLQTADGLGIYAGDDITCVNSVISDNHSYRAKLGFGLGLFAGKSGSITLTGCSIENNDGGGIYATASRSIILRSSTVSGNLFGDGILTKGPVSVFESTISGNQYSGIGTSSVARISNSTIAFNGLNGIGSGSYIYAQSSIFANNGRYDIALRPTFTQLYGNDNLIQTTYNVSPLIGVIVSSADPHLTPLAFHGGVTKSHALLADSPAIDTGNNSASDALDQRGQPRESPSAKPDMGAYERQPNDDELFYSGFQ